MRVLNFFYEDNDKLSQKLSEFSNEENIFIQIFCNSNLKKNATPLVAFIKQNLPKAQILLASSFAEMCDGCYKQN